MCCMGFRGALITLVAMAEVLRVRRALVLVLRGK